MKKLSLFTCSIVLIILLSACNQPGIASQASSQTAQKADSSAAELLIHVKTTQAFADEALPSEAIEAILQAGANAPSAMNTQPWHFAVITDKTMLNKISEEMGSGMPAGGFPPNGAVPPQGIPPQGTPPQPQGDIATVPPGPPPGAGGTGARAPKAGLSDAPLVIIISSKNGSEFDAGLACQNMAAEAQLLGYGTKVLTSPTIALNGSKQEEFKKFLGAPDDHTFVAALLIGKASLTNEQADSVAGASVRNSLSDVVTYVTP